LPEQGHQQKSEEHHLANLSEEEHLISHELNSVAPHKLLKLEAEGGFKACDVLLC
jgi:hypothetical protein